MALAMILAVTGWRSTSPRHCSSRVTAILYACSNFQSLQCKCCFSCTWFNVFIEISSLGVQIAVYQETRSARQVRLVSHVNFPDPLIQFVSLSRKPLVMQMGCIIVSAKDNVCHPLDDVALWFSWNQWFAHDFSKVQIFLIIFSGRLL